MSEQAPLLQDSILLPVMSFRTLKRKKREERTRRIGRATVAFLVAMGMTLILVAYTRSPSHQNTSSSLDLENIMDDYEAYRNFSGVVRVSHNGQKKFAQWNGFANVEFRVSMEKHSIFPIGSNSKLFTSVSLYQLQEQNCVNLSEPINGYLNGDDFTRFGMKNQTTWCPRVNTTDAAAPCENVTFVQLMDMSSGIPDIWNCDNTPANECMRTYESLSYYKGSIGAHVGTFINLPLVFQPGTNYSYSNANYVLLSYMVEKLSGLPFETYLQTNIFDKVGLKLTSYDPYDSIIGVHPGYVDQYVQYYWQANHTNATMKYIDTGSCRPYISNGAVSGSGGFWSTNKDMHKWYMDLFHKQGRRSKVLSEASIRAILQRRNPINPNYAQGIGVVFASEEDDWPTEIAYCGGVKCAITCMSLQMFNDGNSTVIASAFTNQNQAIFPSLEAFKAWRPHGFMPVPENNEFVQSDGGVVVLATKLRDVFVNYTKTAAP